MEPNQDVPTIEEPVTIETPTGTDTNVETTPEAPNDPAVAPDDISLPRAEYNQMLAAIATMQAQLGAQQPQPEAPVIPEPTSEELNQMKPTDLLAYVQQQQQPLMQTVMNMAIQMELRDVKDAHSDFSEYSDQVLQIASSNPSLSLEQAYQLAVASKSKAKPTQPATTTPQPATPKTKATQPPPATRNSPPVNTTQESTVMDPRAAAIAAAKELGIE